MCLESMDDGDQKSRRLACGHYFHNMCLDDLAAASVRDHRPAKCPLCRAPVAHPRHSARRRSRRPVRREVDQATAAAFDLSVCGVFMLLILMMFVVVFSKFVYNPSPSKLGNTWDIGANPIRDIKDDDDNTICSPNKQCVHTGYCDGMGRCTAIEPLLTRVSIDQLDDHQFSTAIHVTNHQHYSSLLNCMVSCTEEAIGGRESIIRIEGATMLAEPLDTTMVNMVFDHSGENPVVCQVVVVGDPDIDTTIYSSTHRAYTPKPPTPNCDQVFGRQACDSTYGKDRSAQECAFSMPRAQYDRRFFPGVRSRYDDDNDDDIRLTGSGRSEDDAGFPCCMRGL